MYSVRNCIGEVQPSKNMLTELHVREFALIDEARLEFQHGMTVFSGETGAGKSILVDALGVVFGARADREWVRHGADRSEITAVLEGVDGQLQPCLKLQGIELNGQLILRRVITADGRSRAYVNGSPVPARTLQDIGNHLLAQHGQHEHQILLKPEFQRRLLDERIDQTELAAVRNAFQCWRNEKQSLERLQAEHGESQRQELWLREEFQRLQELKLESGLEERLRNEVESGHHFSQIHTAAAKSLSLLEDAEINVRGLLAQSQQALEQISGFRQELDESVDILRQMDALLSELEPNLRPVLGESFDPRILNEAEEWLMNLHDAMRRHQTDEPGLIQILDDMQARISGLETADWDLTEQEKRVEAAAQSFLHAARGLSVARNRAAGELCLALRPLMDRLSLAGMQLKIEVRPIQDDISHWTSSGWDVVECIASSNPGEPFRPLSAIASGGELSRLVLALKGCAALTSAPAISVFDEVDAGIGGETAWCVGELLTAMGKERQVLVVSHLPQVAACADHQIRICKRQHSGRTVTIFEKVEKTARLDELARMLGGTNVESRKHAAQMLERRALIDSAGDIR